MPKTLIGLAALAVMCLTAAASVAAPLLAASLTVLAWQADVTRDVVVSALAAVADQTGLPLALMLLALLSRLLVLPFALKSERDQIVADATSDEIAVLKQRLGDDPVRLRRALTEHAERHNLTPLRNLVALLFLPLVVLATFAAGDVAAKSTERWMWVPDLARPDPTIALPILFSLVQTLYVVAAFARTPRQRLTTTAMLLPSFAFVSASLPAAASLYLVITSGLLVAQRAWVTRLPQRARSHLRATRRRLNSHLVGGATRLDHPLPACDVGTKAARLAALAARGYPVPAALILDHAAVAHLLGLHARARTALARRIARALGARRVVVRSSASGEDGPAASFPGVYESALQVTPADLPDAVRRVAASLNANRVLAYRADGGRGNVMVQAMIPSECAGVLFTRAPDAPGQILVELIDGIADDHASGRRTPTVYRFGRLSLAPIDAVPSLDLQPLLRMCQRIAVEAGAPQDIEWAYAGGRFYILQARDIVADRSDRAAIAQCEHLLRLAARETSAPLEPACALFHPSAMAELMPRPTTLSLDLLNALWAPGGSVDHAARTLGMTYPIREGDGPRYARINGRLVADMRLETERAVRVTARRRRRIARDMPRHVARIRGELARIRAEASVAAAIDLTRLTDAEVSAQWVTALRRFMLETQPVAEEVDLLAGLSPASIAVTGTGARPQFHRDLLAARDLPRTERHDAFQRIAGHRSNCDFELAYPRWSEIPGAVNAFVASLSPAPAARDAAVAGALDDLAALKVDARHETLRDLARLRAILLDLDRRYALGGHIFELTLDEVSSLNPAVATKFQIISRERRRAESRLRGDAAPPSRTTARDLELLATPNFGTRAGLHIVDRGGGLRCKGRGSRVSGRLETSGRAYVATRDAAECGSPLQGFRDGDILVTPLVHPDWLGIVLRSGGVVTDTGSWLSPMSIVAREHGIAMIVGVPVAGQFRTGDRLRLSLDGKVMVEADTVARLCLVATR